MNKLLALILLFLVCRTGNAQNLIPNPGFEDYSKCNSGDYEFDEIRYWKDPSKGSPDYFRTCAGLVPDNWSGHQYPFEGESYCGMIIKNSGGGTVEWREYIQCPLKKPLVPGTTYMLSMYVNLAGYGKYGSSSIAGLFTTYPYFYADNLAIPLTPQAKNDSTVFVTDSLGWKLIQMPFIADSAYKYVTIGNFLPDAQTTSIQVLQQAEEDRCYILIDEVSLVVDPIADIDETGLPKGH